MVYLLILKKVDLSMAILVITRWYYSIVLYYNHPPKDRTTICHHELMCGFCQTLPWASVVMLVITPIFILVQ